MVRLREFMALEQIRKRRRTQKDDDLSRQTGILARLAKFQAEARSQDDMQRRWQKDVTRTS